MDIHIMDTNRESVAHILDAFRVLVAALASASRASQQKLGVTGAQHFVLQKLMEAGELSVGELADRTHTHQSTVSTVVTKLVRKGLVNRVRSDSDARVQLLSITPQGRQKLRKPTDTIQDRLINSIEGLSSTKRITLVALLNEVIAGAGIAQSRPVLFFEPGATSKSKDKA